MVVYLDESYDNARTYLVLGALFCPHNRALQRRIVAVKQAAGFTTSDGGLFETKYARVLTPRHLGVALNIGDAFFESTAWFRAIVVRESLMDLSRFGGPQEPAHLKRARAYKKFAELLLGHNTHGLTNGVLLTDRMSRCRGDEFIERMRDAFCVAGFGWSRGKTSPTFRHIDEVASDLAQYQCLQLCDLLTGCVLNRLLPGRNVNKRQLAEHVFRRAGIDRVPMTEWWRISKRVCEREYPKLHIWGWRPRK